TDDSARPEVSGVRQIAGADDEGAAKRIGTGKGRAREGLIDHDNRDRTGGIVFAKHAPLQQRNSHRAEVVRIDGAVPRIEIHGTGSCNLRAGAADGGYWKIDR